jgi:hypothetical protein
MMHMVVPGKLLLSQRDVYNGTMRELCHMRRNYRIWCLSLKCDLSIRFFVRMCMVAEIIGWKIPQRIDQIERSILNNT